MRLKVLDYQFEEFALILGKMDSQPSPKQLFLLCDDVVLEIYKYLSKNDLENLSLSCKKGYQSTKLHFEKQTLLKFVEPLNLQDLQTLSNSTRNHDEVLVVSADKRRDRNSYDVIIDQLSYLKIKPSSVILKKDWRSDYSESEQISKFKAKHKNVSRVLFDPEGSFQISSIDDIQQLKDQNICPKDLTTIELSLNPDDGCFDERFFETFVSEFSGVKELKVKRGYSFVRGLVIDLPEDHDIHFNIGTVKFTEEGPEDLNFLKLLGGVKELILYNCWDSLFVKTLLNLNQKTLKYLHLGLYHPSANDLVIPCQLETLKVSTEKEFDIEHLIENQNELQHLILAISFTPYFFAVLSNHCAPHLDITNCSYNFYMGSVEEIRKSIPDLPMVKHLEVNQVDLLYFLPKTVNLETLSIDTFFYDSGEDEVPTKGVDCLNGLELQHLKTLNLKGSKEFFYKPFSSITLNIPKLTSYKGQFHLNLLKKYPQIKNLEIYFCYLDDFLDLLSHLPNLEVLKFSTEVEDLSKVLNHLELADLGGHLKYVEIKAKVCSDERFDILKKMELKGDKIFSNYKSDEKVYNVHITVGVDVLEKQFMYTFLEK